MALIFTVDGKTPVLDLGIMTPTVGALTSQAADLLTNFSNNFASVSKAGRQELAANSV